METIKSGSFYFTVMLSSSSRYLYRLPSFHDHPVCSYDF